MMTDDTPLLEIRELSVAFQTESGVVHAVEDVSLSVEASQVLAIVGESGSGKSVSMLSVMGLLNDPNAIVEGTVLFKGRNLMTLPPAEFRSLRGSGISMIFQDPMTSLNPVYRVGWQIEEQLRAHLHLSRRAARSRALELMTAVGIPDPASRIDNFPHEFSGGMRQRIMIAMALSCNPDLLIADEPTTALDVTVQAQILDLIKRLQEEFGSAVIYITHDLGVVAELADRVAVMYAGRVVEEGPRRQLFYDPQHPYTWGLLGSIPRLDLPRARRLVAIPGAAGAWSSDEEGCAFAPRCSYRIPICTAERPALNERASPDHRDACHLQVERKRAARELSIAATKT
jgi:peptide/nickel transport system ATP-binding protein